jgi:hypothetical protein
MPLAESLFKPPESAARQDVANKAAEAAVVAGADIVRIGLFIIPP